MSGIACTKCGKSKCMCQSDSGPFEKYSDYPVTPAEPGVSEPPVISILKRLMPVLICRHEHTRGGNDYLSCDDCGFEWDYTRRDAQLAVTVMNNDIAALFKDAVPAQASGDAEQRQAIRELVMGSDSDEKLVDEIDAWVAEARQGDAQRQTYERDAAAEKYPVPVVCAVILRDGQVLLERRATTGVEGLDRMWDVPGGKMEKDETPQQAIAREIDEEQGLQVSVGSALPLRTSTWVYHGKQRYWLLVPYVCSLVSGEPKLTDDLKWWPIDALPDQMLVADREMVADACGGQGDAQRIAELDADKKWWLQERDKEAMRGDRLAAVLGQAAVYIRESQGYVPKFITATLSTISPVSAPGKSTEGAE